MIECFGLKALTRIIIDSFENWCSKIVLDLLRSLNLLIVSYIALLTK